MLAMKQKQFFEAQEFKDIKELLYNSAEKFADKTAFIVKEKIDKKVEYKHITYSNFLKDINKLGTALFNLNLKGKRIAVVGKNSYEWAVAHLTNMLGGIVSVPLDKDLQKDELETSLIRSKADAIIFDEKHVDIIKEIQNDGKTNLFIFICKSKVDGYLYIYDLIEEGAKLIEQGDRSYIDVKIDNKAMAVLIFTSGTTSKPKAVMLSHKNIASNIYAMQLVEPFKQEDRNLALLPFNHVFGSTGLLVMLTCGICTAFPDGLRYIAQNLKEYKITFFVGVPLLIETIYNKMMQEVKKQGKDKKLKVAIKLSNILLKCGIDIRRKLFKSVIDNLGGMRFMISGGAPLDPKVSKGFNDLGIYLVQGYGLTETAPVVAAEDAFELRSGSIGKPMTNLKLEIADKDENGIGELRVKGPNVMLGYYEDEERTKEVLKDGWFYTGDLGYIDKDGFVFITGRAKSMIVLKNGKKVFPEELETLVNNIDVVKESMVFGLPKADDVKLSVEVVLDKEVVENKYSNMKEEELKNYVWKKIKEVNKSFPKYKYIKNMVISNEELIKTTTQKLKREEEFKKIVS
jgi:long-chain acyl-CoA synthetase